MRFYYSDNLPVAQRRDEIGAQLLAHQVIIVAGDTGSGKTTQIPKIILETLDDPDLVIGCTQPRRIAATSIAARVADELGEHGHLVGYKIRFHDHTSEKTRIKFMTDGVLLAETRTDPLLRSYNVIILDEAHERSLNIDFLLGYLKRILPRRPDLKLVITSATIDTEAFSKHFDNAPVISVAGKTYPVTVRYRPLDDGDEEYQNTSYVEHCAAAITEICSSDPQGDILAFLPTEKDIRKCCELLSAIENRVILPMFGSLQAGDQKRIFQKFNRAKVVVATNVAETSVTVPGIRYVVDSGLARMSYYNARAKTTSLPIQRISRASSNQRKGRCGRVGPGICIRLYSEDDFTNRDEYTLPEIKRANLAEVVLQMISLKLGKPEDFPFIDPPNKNAIRDGYRLLSELGAFSPKGELSKTGRFMARLPIDPCISRILIEAAREGCLKEVKIIAAALAIQDPRVRPAEKEKEADSAHAAFSHPHSDFMVLLNIWNGFFTDDRSWSWSGLKRYCKANFLSFQRMREWFDLHEQLDRLLKRDRDNFRDNSEEGSYQQIHRALLSGFLRNIAQKKKGKIYQGAANKELMIFPGSHQFLTGGQWIAAASFLETSRLYGLTVATIEPEWIEQLGTHLVKYSWSNPRWNKKSGQVVADEKVSLFGLTVVSARTVNFPKRSDANIPEARQIFIQAALIDGEITGRYKFIDQNRALIEKWRDEEAKLRTSTLLLDDIAFHEFYDTRLPDSVYDRQTLNRFLKKRGFKSLLMCDQDVLRGAPDEDHGANFPSQLEVGGMTIPLSYSFTPGEEQDGLTAQLPVSVATAISPLYFDWLVPGLLREKVTFLLKGLPKSLRRHLVPVNVAVDRILDDMNLYNGSLFLALENSIHKLYRIGVNRTDWPTELPTHLQARFSVVDTERREICSGRNLTQLVKDIEKNRGKAAAPGKVEISGDTKKIISRWKGFQTDTWTFDGLPATVSITNSNGDVVGVLFSSLIPQPEKGSVAVTFVDTLDEAKTNNFSGCEHLYRLQFRNEYKSLQKFIASLVSAPSVRLLFSGHKSATAKEAVMQFVMGTLFPGIDGSIPSKEQFDREVAAVRSEGFYKKGQDIADSLGRLMRKRGELLQHLKHYAGLDKRKHIFTREKTEYFTSQINGALSEDFFKSGSAADIDLAMRKLQSLAIRIERRYANPHKDEQKETLLRPHLNNLAMVTGRYEQIGEDGRLTLAQYRRLIDEYSIKLFSPEIKTSSVSEKKLKAAWNEVQAKC